MEALSLLAPDRGRSIDSEMRVRGLRPLCDGSEVERELSAPVVEVVPMTQKTMLSSPHDVPFSKLVFSQANVCRRAQLVKALATCVMRDPTTSNQINRNDL